MKTASYCDAVLTAVVERLGDGRVELNLNDGDYPELLAARIEAAARTLMTQP